MQKTNLIPPAINAPAFSCPNCQVFARQTWYFLRASEREDGFGTQYEDKTFRVSFCENCRAITIWRGSEMVFPLVSSAEPPSSDLPTDIREDYEEARIISKHSPRGSAALLRLCVQKLCAHLGQPGKSINSDIAALVELGLPVRVQQALDTVRVIGNDAVHPGAMDLRDDRQTVDKLFRLVNFIAQKMIAEPREIDELYNGLPKDKLAAIAKRDE